MAGSALGWCREVHEAEPSRVDLDAVRKSGTKTWTWTWTWTWTSPEGGRRQRSRETAGRSVVVSGRCAKRRGGYLILTAESRGKLYL